MSKKNKNNIYTIYLGSLKNSTKADEMLKKLRRSGYKAFAVPSNLESENSVDVYIGPILSEPRTKKVANKLKKKVKLNEEPKFLKNA